MQYGNDKPDIRFGMEFGELNAVAQNKEFAVFNTAESSWYCSSRQETTRKETDL
jgi:aspartyl-tRNA synthetase